MKTGPQIYQFSGIKLPAVVADPDNDLVIRYNPDIQKMIPPRLKSVSHDIAGHFFHAQSCHIASSRIDAFLCTKRGDPAGYRYHLLHGCRRKLHHLVGGNAERRRKLNPLGERSGEFPFFDPGVNPDHRQTDHIRQRERQPHPGNADHLRAQECQQAGQQLLQKAQAVDEMNPFLALISPGEQEAADICLAGEDQDEIVIRSL